MLGGSIGEVDDAVGIVQVITSGSFGISRRYEAVVSGIGNRRRRKSGVLSGIVLGIFVKMVHDEGRGAFLARNRVGITERRIGSDGLARIGAVAVDAALEDSCDLRLVRHGALFLFYDRSQNERVVKRRRKIGMLGIDLLVEVRQRLGKDARDARRRTYLVGIGIEESF